MRTKEELVAEALKEHTEEQERNFKSRIRNAISKIGNEQVCIAQCNERIKLEQKYISELEMTPFDPTTILPKEDDGE